MSSKAKAEAPDQTTHSPAQVQREQQGQERVKTAAHFGADKALSSCAADSGTLLGGGRAGLARQVQRQVNGRRVSRAVGRSSADHMLRRQKCTCGGEAGQDGECAACKARRLQAKMTVGAPGDAYEQEADAVSRQVVQRIQRVDTGTQDQLMRPQLQTQATAPGEATDTQVTPEIEQNLANSAGRGQPLGKETRSRMEGAIGADFGGVRLHTDANADHLNRSLNARAFTTGHDIYFKQGEFNPDSNEGQGLLAHELTHVVQQEGGSGLQTSLSSLNGIRTISRLLMRLVQRQPDAGPSDAGPSDAGPSDAGAMGETRQYDDVTLSSDPGYTYDLLKRMYAANGEDQVIDFVSSYEVDIVLPRRPSAGISDDPELARDESILNTLNEQRDKIFQEAQNMRDLFSTQARANTFKMLENNRLEVEKEAIRYGLTSRQIQEIRHRIGPEKEHWDEVIEHTEYGMDTETGSSKGLAAAAKVLLDHRKPIIDKQKQQWSHACDEMESEYDGLAHSTVCVGGPEYYRIGQEIEKLEQEYDTLRAALITEYPMLAPMSEDKRDNSKLETIVENGPSQQVATLIGQQVAEKTEKIAKVKQGLEENDVDIWRLPRVVELTSAQLGIAENSFEAKVIAEEEAEHRPGIIKEILLLALNLLAVITAPMTAGLSLAVAAGVNAVSAAYSVKDYIMKDALRHSALDVAKALSAEEPSLFWLAMDIAGVFMDVGGAAAAVAKAFKVVGPAAKAAMVVKEGEEAVKALDELRAIAKTELKDAAKAEAIVSKVDRLRKGGSALEAVGATKLEAKALEEAARAGDELVKDAVSAVKTASGEVKLTKTGHIFSCTSPCSMLREKYAEVLARDPKLKQELAALEQRAQQAASAAGGEGAKLRKGALEAAAELEGRLKISNIQAKLEHLVAKYPILAEHKLDSAALQRILAKADNIDHAKGQLLEEIAAKRVEKILQSKEAVANLLGKDINAKLEFIPGHTITDKAGKQFTDGMIVFRQKDGSLRVVGIVESKAGRASSRGLGRSYKPLKEMSPEELEDAREFAIDLLKDKRPKLANLSNEQILKNHRKEVEKLMSDLPRAEAGQVRKDIERLVPNVDDKTTTVMINGKPEQVIGGQRSTRILGVAPGDINMEGLATKLADEKLNFGRLDVDIDQKSVKALAEEIIQLGKSGK